MNYYEVVRRANLKYRSITRLTEPVIEPVSLSQAKSHLRIDDEFTQDDQYIQSLVSAARYYVESVSDRTLVRSQWQLKLDQFPSWDIELPRPPLAVGDVVVRYVPSQNPSTELTFTQFRLDRDSTPAVIRPEWNGSWPTCRGAENDITITYWAGYGESVNDIPAPARHCILLMIGHWYSTREAAIQGGMNPVPMAVDAMLGSINWGQYR